MLALRCMHSGLHQGALEWPDRIAVRTGDRDWTYLDLDRAAAAVAEHLSTTGIGPGDRVAVMSANRVEFLIVVMGISRAGASAVLLSPAWKSTEARHGVELTGSVRAFADGGAVGILSEILGADSVIDLDGEIMAGVLATDVSLPPPSEVDIDAEAVCVFSSGTTGLPKAVRHTHSSIAHSARHWSMSLGLTSKDRIQVATPPSHILGLMNLLITIDVGASVRLHARFDLDQVLHCIEQDRVTIEMAVAPIALAMANHPSLERFDLSSLRYIVWAATPVTPSVAERVTARTGVRWLAAYGASEHPVLSCNPVHEPERWRLDSPGLPPDGVELRVVDLDDGRILPPGETGELEARSPALMAGYLPEEANEAAFDDGWYRTGDVGWLEEEGWVHLTDRSKEMIKVRGFQVAPAEIEAVLLGHPAVRDCAVFGVTDEISGERPVAAVELADGASVDVEELKTLVADALASYKQLSRVVVVETVPRLPSGKVLRRTLRDEWGPRIADEAG